MKVRRICLSCGDTERFRLVSPYLSGRTWYLLIGKVGTAAVVFDAVFPASVSYNES